MADWRRLLSVLIAAAVPMAVHAQVLGFPFVSFDDPVYVAESPFYGPGVSLTELLLTPQLGYPIPVTVAAYRLVEAVFGVETWAFHGLNWLLHAGAGLLLFLFLERLLDRRRALLGSLLWSLHPLAVEPVAWCSATKDLLYAVFTLAALHLHVRATAPRETGGSVAGVLVFGVLALLSKPVAFLLPVVLLAWPLATGRTATLREARHRMLYTTLAVVAAFVVVTGTLLSANAGEEIRYRTIQDIPVLGVEHLLVILSGTGVHARNLLLPLDLVPAYLPPDQAPWTWIYPLLGAIAAALTVLGLILTWRQGSRVRFWLLAAFAISYLPVSQAVPTIHFAPDSYLYVPGMFLAGFTVSWLPGFPGAATAPPLPRDRWRARGLSAAAAAFFILLGLLSMSQARIWSSSVALWEANMAREPRNALVAFNLADALHEAGRSREAGALLERRLDDIVEQDAAMPFVTRLFDETHDPEATRAFYVRLLKRDVGEVWPQHAQEWVAFLHRHGLALRPGERELTRQGLELLAEEAVARGELVRLPQLAGAAHRLGLIPEAAAFLEEHWRQTGDPVSGRGAMLLYRSLGMEEERRSLEEAGVTSGGIPGAGPHAP